MKKYVTERNVRPNDRNHPWVRAFALVIARG